MKSMRWQFSSRVRSWLPKLQAHRGYWVGGLLQNTLPAIQKAAELNYEMVEFDVQLTADKMVVLFHDEKIQGKLISKILFDDLIKLTPLNTLEEVCFWLSQYSDKNFKFNIELKTGKIFGSVLEKKVAQIIKHFQLENQVLVSSFNPLALGRMRWLNRQVFRALLLTLEDHPKNKWYFRNMMFNFFARPHVLNLRHEDWTKEKFARVSRIVPVVLWTYNQADDDAKDAAQFQKGMRFDQKLVHGVISDDITPQK